jgi:hypothetical protein
MVSVRRRPWHPERLTPAEQWVVDAVRPQVEARPEQLGPNRGRGVVCRRTVE